MRNSLSGALLALTVLAGNASAQSLDVPVRLMLFADATFTETERDIPDGFALGQVVGHMSASLSERLLVFAEATLSPTGGAPVATIERVIVRYDFGDWLKVSGGRYHTPVSWWNTAYHHGSWLQTSIARPRMVRFGTPLVPIHFLGLLAEGTVATGPLLLGYEAGIGNGRQDNIALPGDAGDDDGSLALVGGLRLRTLAVPGAELGGSVYVDDVQGVEERILSAHIALQRTVEFIAEFMRIGHDFDAALGPDDFDTDAWYVHLGYRLPESLLGLRPYARIERIETPIADPLFGGLGLDFDAVLAGVRWDFSDYAALKLEYRDEEVPATPAGADDGRSLLVNVSVVIPNMLGSGAR